MDQIPPQSLLSEIEQIPLGFLTLHGDEGMKGMKTRRTLGVVDGLEGEREMISLPYGSTSVLLGSTDFWGDTTPPGDPADFSGGNYAWRKGVFFFLGEL